MYIDGFVEYFDFYINMDFKFISMHLLCLFNKYICVCYWTNI